MSDIAQRPTLARLPLLALAFVALATGVGAGLARFGYSTPGAAPAVWHGALMICGFFGVVIALERAVALGNWWGYLAPLAGGIGTLLALAASPLAPWLWLACAVGFLAASIEVLRRQRIAATLMLALGALAWAIGTALLAAGEVVHESVPYWIAFLVLTIAGERLELSRLMPPSAVARRVLFAIVAAVALALALGIEGIGPRLLGAALLALAAWLGRQDIARRTIRSRGLPRYTAACLLSGYVWLAISGATMLAFGLEPGHPSDDAALHALLLGFVFSMVFGHAPIIFPAVLRIAIPYGASFYVPLVLLHAALALRVAGDATGVYALARLGALASGIALLVFVLVVIAAVIRGRFADPTRRRTAPR